MFLNVQRGSDRAKPDGPAERVRSCHEKIRRFAALAVRLASPGDAPASQVAEAAAQVHRYFTHALPLHAADEDESIRPRLEAIACQAEITTALETVSREHLEHDRAIRALAPLWLAAAEGRAAPGDLARELEAARRLEGILATHLELEERTVLPAFELFAADVAATIVQEMKKRRGVA